MGGHHGAAMGHHGAAYSNTHGVAMGGHGLAIRGAAETLEDHRRDAYIPQKRAVDPKLRLPLQPAAKRPAASQPPAYSAIMDPAAQLARNRSAAANRAAADVRYPHPSYCILNATFLCRCVYLTCNPSRRCIVANVQPEAPLHSS